MNKILISTIMILGLKSNVLKASIILSFTGLGLMKWFSELFKDFPPDYFLGVTIFLWAIYAFTIMLDWVTGIKAARYEANIKNESFKFDRQKSSTSWFKHALFIIIIASIYNFQEEAIRKEFNLWVINGLTGLQFIYFAYNMITEWVSIEDNRFRVSGKKSRISKLMTMVLDTLDAGAKKKLKDITNTKDNE